MADLPPDPIDLSRAGHVFENLSVSALVEEAVKRGEGILADNGALVVRTGKYTGRSPGDKFITDDALTESQVDWGKVNQPFDPDTVRAPAGPRTGLHSGPRDVRL